MIRNRFDSLVVAGVFLFGRRRTSDRGLIGRDRPFAGFVGPCSVGLASRWGCVSPPQSPPFFLEC